MLTCYKPEYRDLWFRQFMLSDPETMSYNHAWGGTISFPEERWQEWYDFWIREPEGKRFYRYLRDECGTFVGEIAYHFDSGLNGYIADVIVLASQRGKGYGGEALELLCAEAAKNGVPVLYDDIAIDNPAIALFQKHGFIEESRTDEKIILKRETKEPETNMAENHKTKVARRGDWKTTPMPRRQETFVLHRALSDREMDALRLGNVPQAMEDKWFWYMEGSTLWAHRSWTGHCIYRIDFKEDQNHVVTVNRDPKQYKCTSTEEDIASLNKLLDWWTEIPYDHYHEWLSETYDALKKADEEK